MYMISNKIEISNNNIVLILYTILCPESTFFLLGCVGQSVTRLATDASLTADPRVPRSIPARSHNFVEIDHEIISTVILLPSAESFKKEGLLSVTSESMCTKY